MDIIRRQNNIFILDAQNDSVIGHINKQYVLFNEHEESLENRLSVFEMTCLASAKHTDKLNKRNGLIVPGEDDELLEFRIFESIKYRDTEGLKVETYATATYLDLKKAKVFNPHKTSAESAFWHAEQALEGTEWQVGQVDFKGVRTLDFDSPFNSYEYLHRIARDFELELRFYIKTDGNKVTGRYVDLVERIGDLKGRTIEFGRDMTGIQRKENTAEIVTALWVYGPEKEDGTRMKVFVEDLDALERWGRHGKHLVEYYEPQTENENITEARLKTLGEMELKKRINAIVEYEIDFVDLEHIPGLDTKKVRLGDTIRSKDIHFNPPLYVEARIFNQKRDVFNKSIKTAQLGDYQEFTEEEVKAIWKQMQEEIRRRLEKLVLANIVASAGTVFKNGIGSTELTAKTFLSGNEVDEDGTKYEYRWHKFDKNGDYVAGFYEEGKTIAVSANTIDEKAAFRVEIILDSEVLTIQEITLTNVFDGEDGEDGAKGEKGDKGDPGEDGKTYYTWIKYADTPTSGMSDNPTNKEYIGIAYNKESPTPSTNYSDYQWSKYKGDQGIPGQKGEDGQPTYTWVKYADDENGSGMSDSPDGKLYIGLAFNKTTAQESNNPNDYKWSEMPQNIEIGGRNLLFNSTFNNGLEGWRSNNYLNYAEILPPENDKPNSNILKLTMPSDFSSPCHNDNRIYAEVGEVFCLSLDLRKTSTESFPVITIRGWDSANGTGNGSMYGVFEVSGNRSLSNSHFNAPLNVWKRYVFLYKVTKNGWFSVAPYFANAGQTYDIRELKLEKGNKATDWDLAPEDIQAEMDESKQIAYTAMQSADGKNAVFRQSNTPPTTNRKIGDLWFKTNEGNRMYVWTGSAWTETKLDYQALSVGKLSAISADLGNVTAGKISGVTMNLANGKVIVDSNGNATFKGNLEGASGTFGKASVVDGDFTIKDSTTQDETIVNTGSNIVFDHSFELVRPHTALEPIDPNNPYIASICSVDTSSLSNFFGMWNNSSPSNARIVRAFDAESRHIFSGLNSVILRGQDYGMWDQICYIPEQVRRTNALSLSCYVAPFEKTTTNVSVSLRIQLVNSSGNWVADLASKSFAVDHTKKYNWQRVSVTYKGGLNIGSNRLRVRLMLNNNTSSAMLLCDGVQLVPFEHPTLYEPETSLFNFMNGIGAAPGPTLNTVNVLNYADVRDLHVSKIHRHAHAFLSLQNGWQNYGGDFQPARYTKQADGTVLLSGMIRNGTMDATAGRLPAGCRPNMVEAFAVATGGTGTGMVYVYPNGNVVPKRGGSWVSLSGISFLGEN